MTEPQADGLSDWAAETYLREILDQVESAQLAIAGFNFHLGQHDPRTTSQVFAAAQSLLGAAAQISKLIWPRPPAPRRNDPEHASKERLRAFTLSRGNRLRELLSIDALPVLEGRTVRNAIEHFDERLDEYFIAGHTNVFDRNIGPKERLVIVDGEVPLHLRLIDNERLTVAVLDAEVSLQEVADAIGRVQEAATEALARLQRSRGLPPYTP
jgi:hypothetical protein